MKKDREKLVAAALALTMVLSMAACSMGDEKKNLPIQVRRVTER